MQWIQNGSIQFFPTHILRQNHLAPFAEWNLLNLRLLAGNDQLFNLVQWFCYCGGCVAASLIARLLGAGRAGQWFAVAFVACTPMAVLQSTSTQNDLVAGFFLLCFIYFGLLMSNGSRRSRERWLDSIFCGLSLGLGLLTKSTIYLFAFPFSLYIACRLFHCCRWRMFFHGGLIAVCVALILTGHTVRNFRSYHHLLGPLGELCGDTITFKYQNDRMDAGRFCYSLLRNIGLHGNIDGVPNFRYAIQTGIQSAAHWLGVPEDDPATTWLGTTFELSDKRHEDLSGNFPQVVIFSLACALLLFQRRDSGTRIIYGLCIIAGGFLFALVLRWQPWHARLHTPLFMAMAPFCGSVFGAWRARGLAAIPACILVYYAVPFLVMNNARPLFGKANVFQTKREKQYFISNSSLARPYKNAVALLKSEHCKNVGLQTDLNDFQYPFWVLAERAGIPDTRFIQVNVANISKTLGAKIIPDAVIATSMPPGGNMSVGGVQYHCALQDVGISVYLKNR